MPDRLQSRGVVVNPPAPKRLSDMGDNTFAERVTLGNVLPETWTVPGTAFDARTYSDVEVQFVTTPGVAYQPQRSLDGSNFVNCKMQDEDGNDYSTITAAGIYSFKSANAYVRFSAGSGSTLTRRAAV